MMLGVLSNVWHLSLILFYSRSFHSICHCLIARLTDLFFLYLSLSLPFAWYLTEACSFFEDQTLSRGEFPSLVNRKRAYRTYLIMGRTNFKNEHAIGNVCEKQSPLEALLIRFV